MLREALLLLAWLAPLLAFSTAAPGKRGPSPRGWAEVAGPLCGTPVRVPKGQAAIWVDAGWRVPRSLAGVCAGSEAGVYSPAGMMGFFWVDQLSPGNHIGGRGGVVSQPYTMFVLGALPWLPHLHGFACRLLPAVVCFPLS